MASSPPARLSPAVGDNAAADAAVDASGRLAQLSHARLDPPPEFVLDHRSGVRVTLGPRRAWPYQLPSRRICRERVAAISLNQMPGEGVEPSRPHWGQLILSQPRMSSFATPAVEQRSVAAARDQVPGWFVDIAMPSGPLPRNASRNFLNAPSSNRSQVATWPVP